LTDIINSEDTIISSNLSESVNLILKAGKHYKHLPSGDYEEKRILHNFRFPFGLMHDRKIGSVRANEYNALFLWIICKSQDLEQKKCGTQELNLSYAAFVAGG
jgi:hypothetical protein